MNARGAAPLGIVTAVDLYAAHALRVASDADVVAWACARLAEDPALEDPLIVELAGLTEAEVRAASNPVARLVAALARRGRPDFVVASPEGERIARRLLAAHCRRYLAGGITPHVCCAVVPWYEEAFDFPAWLAGLYDACDWVGPGHREDPEAPHLAREAEEVLRRLADLAG